MATNVNPDDSNDMEKINATALANSRQKSLELLFEYTKWHIGIYLTLTGAYLTAAFANFSGRPVLSFNLYLLWPAILFTMIAGLAGGVIASSLTQWCEGGGSRDFLQAQIGPWEWKRLHFPAKAWTYVEHTAFWIGLIAAVASFIPPEAWAQAGVGFLEGGYRTQQCPHV